MRKTVVRSILLLAAANAFGAAACASSSNLQSMPGGSGSSSGSGGNGTGFASGSSSGPGGSGSLAGGTSSTGGTATGSSGSTAAMGSTGSSSGSASTGGSTGPSSDAGMGTTCSLNCTGKTCGDDGCGGTCGGCPPSQLCGPAQTCIAASSTTSIVVDAKSQGTPISSAIYGVSFNNDDSMKIAALNRWGGDAVSSYNWEIDVSNSGADWNCANYTGRFTSPAPDPSLKTSSDQFVHYNIAEHADTLMTIPITGWVASMATPNPGTPDCAGGTAIATCCQTLGTSEEKLVDQGSKVLDTSFMGSWVTHLVSTFGSAAQGGVKYYQLDNEPDNWQNLRKDIYPSLYPPGTSCEPFYSTNSSIGTSLNQDFIDRTMAYAKAIKTADPTASVLFMSTENAWDLVAIPNDECGNPAGPYTTTNSLTGAILQLAATAEASDHVRLLDCVDMHYPFPGTGLGDTDALWDPTVTQYNTPIIPPRIQGWINATYPGTSICVSEYNVPNDGTNGSAPDVSTGAQEADILGMFGRLGYTVASYFLTLVNGTTHLPVYNAMAMYRNYDGNGGRFGTYSIGAASPTTGIHVYAASDSPTNPSKVWIMLVNVSAAAQTAPSIMLQNFASGTSAQVYRMTNGGAPTADTALAVSNGTITGVSLPVDSAALLVISK